MFFHFCPQGEIIHIVIEEYVQHVSGYNLKLLFDPPLIFKDPFQYNNRIAMEFAQLYHWHSLLPDSFLIDGDDILLADFLYNNTILTHYGVEKLVDSFSRQHAGQVVELIVYKKPELVDHWCIGSVVYVQLSCFWEMNLMQMRKKGSE